MTDNTPTDLSLDQRVLVWLSDDGQNIQVSTVFKVLCAQHPELLEAITAPITKLALAPELEKELERREQEVQEVRGSCSCTFGDPCENAGKDEEYCGVKKEDIEEQLNPEEDN